MQLEGARWDRALFHNTMGADLSTMNMQTQITEKHYLPANYYAGGKNSLGFFWRQ